MLFDHIVHLYTVCVQCATDALSLATCSKSLRELRAECEVESEELEADVGDLIFVSFFLLYNVPSTLSPSLHSLVDSHTSLTRRHTHSLFSITHGSTRPMSPSPNLKTHRKSQALDKPIKKLEEAVKKSDWEGAIRVFWGSGGLKKDDGVE